MSSSPGTSTATSVSRSGKCCVFPGLSGSILELVPMTIDQIEREALILYKAGLSLFTFLKETGLRPAFPAESRIRGQNSEAARRKRRKGTLDERRTRPIW